MKKVRLLQEVEAWSEDAGEIRLTPGTYEFVDQGHSEKGTIVFVFAPPWTVGFAWDADFFIFDPNLNDEAQAEQQYRKWKKDTEKMEQKLTERAHVDG